MVEHLLVSIRIVGTHVATLRVAAMGERFMHLDHATLERTTPSGSALRVYMLGVVDFEAALTLQRTLAFEAAGAAIPRRWCCASIHRSSRSAATARPRTSAAILRNSAPDAGRCDGSIAAAARFCTCPAKWPFIPSCPWTGAVCGLADYLERLQRILAAVLDDFSVQAVTRSEQPGLWGGEASRWRRRGRVRLGGLLRRLPQRQSRFVSLPHRPHRREGTRADDLASTRTARTGASRAGSPTSARAFPRRVSLRAHGVVLASSLPGTPSDRCGTPRRHVGTGIASRSLARLYSAIFRQNLAIDRRSREGTRWIPPLRLRSPFGLRHHAAARPRPRLVPAVPRLSVVVVNYLRWQDTATLVRQLRSMPALRHRRRGSHHRG